MIPLKLSEISDALGVRPLVRPLVPQEARTDGRDASRDVTIESIVSDSRKVEFGSLFAALPGSQVDGHDFGPAAVRMGAVALLVQRPLELADERIVPQLVVDDVQAALGRLATLLRDRLDPLVVGITGSNGKTTVKEMVASILRRRGPVLATRGNYNNELGVPLSVFGLEPQHRFAVLELGASKAGDIEYLARMVRPDVAVVTNVGPAHLGGFGSIEVVAQTKGAIYASLPPEGCAVINADEPWGELWRSLSGARRELTFGTGEGPSIRLEGTEERPRIVTPAGAFDFTPALPGHHNLLNAMTATAIVLALGPLLENGPAIDIEDIRAGLESVQPVPGRLNFIETRFGWTVIDDSYNANPASLYSALQVLRGMQGTPWLVLGDMKELGEGSSKMHREVGDAARAMGVTRLFATGEMSACTVDAFGEGAQHFHSREQLADSLRRALRPGINVLVKGSRSMGMEAVVRAITAEAGNHEKALRETG